jgi:hypothetical protein
MVTKNLGRLQRVPLREAWTSESSDFTPWLAQAENLNLLAESIGIELELDTREKDVGPFRADILCKDTADNWVLIENQLERTDHCHLGQLLTYAAGLNAVTIVWVAERFTEEHRAALTWLNEHTDEKINLFGLEIELWRIGESSIAPKFNIISQPNDWSRTVQQAAASGEVSEHKQLQLRFWTGFRDYMDQKASFVRCQKPSPQHWMNHAIGRAGAHLTSVVSIWNSQTNVRGPEIRAELYLDGPTSKQDFAALEKQKDAIERTLGFPLNWHNPENKTACRLSTRQDADFLNESLWPQHFEWLRQKLETMHKVFAPIVRNLKTDLGQGTSDAAAISGVGNR